MTRLLSTLLAVVVLATPAGAQVTIAPQPWVAGGGIARGPILLPAGTAAAPSLAFATDAGVDSGVFLIGANDIGLSTAGVQRLSLNTTRMLSTLPFQSSSAADSYFTGNLGIGTTGPDTLLDILTGTEIAKEVGATGGVHITNANQLIGAHRGNLHLYTNSASGANVGGTLVFGGLSFADDNTLSYAAIKGAKETATDHIGGILIFGTRPDGGSITERIRITSAGNLGIGTTAPNLLSSLGAANGQQTGEGFLTELTTIAAAATTDTAIEIPIDSIVLGVSVRVTTVIPTAATFTVTGTTTGTTFNTAAVNTAANTTDVGTLNAPYRNGAAQTIRITPNLTPANNTGRVRVTIHYIQLTAATS